MGSHFLATALASPVSRQFTHFTPTVGFFFGFGFMAQLPPQADISDLRMAFILMDSDNDGRVTAMEIQNMLSSLGIVLREEVVVNLVRQASQSGSTLMNETEFYDWVKRIQSLRQDAFTVDDDPRQDFVAAFRVFDSDNNGFITKDELRLAMELISEPVTETGLNDLIKIADVDKDGRINYEEFAKMLL